MLYLSGSHRPRRTGEWTDAKAVTFIVTLAAACAGMSRKSAYALRGRDPAFAAAWDAAWDAGAPHLRQAPAWGLSKGDKGNEVHNPPFAPPLGDSVTLRRGRSADAQRRDRFFANLAATRVACAPALP